MYSPNEKSVLLDNFIGGLNVTKSPSVIGDNQTPDAQNWINNELQGINSRYGYTRYYSTALNSSEFNGIFAYNTFSTSQFIIANGTSLILDVTTGTQILYSGMASGRVRAFEMEGNIYFVDGSGYVQYNGVSAAAVSGYIPTYYADKNPDGTGGGQIEELNYIQSAFTETFSGNATATTFYMSFGSLTTGNNIVLVNNATLTSGAATSGFNVNYASGYFTLTTAATSGIGNVEITTHKPVLDAAQVLNCTLCQTYGNGNNTNVYFSGNSSFPSRMFWSDIGDPTYFPATSYADIGVKNDKMMGFIPFGGSLLLAKFRSIYKQIGVPPNQVIQEVYNGEGLIASDTLRIVDGFPTFLSQRGVVFIKGISNVEYFEGYNLPLLSEDINGARGIRSGLLDESDTNKEKSFAEVHENKYWLFINNKIYLYQYDLKHQSGGKIVYPWLKWTPINANCVAVRDNYLYFGGVGNMYKFDPNSTNDDGTAIDSFYFSKKMEVNETQDWVKLFLYIYFNFWRRYGSSTVDFSVFIDDNEVSISADRVITSFWDPNSFNPNSFNPNIVETSQEIRLPIQRKGRFIQFKIRSGALNNTYTVLSAKINYLYDRKR
jgi:hypothetical protein